MNYSLDNATLFSSVSFTHNTFAKLCSYLVFVDKFVTASDILIDCSFVLIGCFRGREYR